LAELADEFVAINNEVVDYAHELGLTVWTHNCRGNYESRSAAEGTYEAIAKKFLAGTAIQLVISRLSKPSKTARLKLY